MFDCIHIDTNTTCYYH